jgi:hypothetical protein
MSPGEVGKANCPFFGKRNCPFCRRWQLKLLFVRTEFRRTALPQRIAAVVDTTAIPVLGYASWTKLREQVERNDDPFRAMGGQKNLFSIYSVSVDPSMFGALRGDALARLNSDLNWSRPSGGISAVRPVSSNAAG